jgi:hypothetical protein
MLKNETEVAELADRVAELAEMMKRTALDEDSPRDERFIEVNRLMHLVRRRLDTIAAVMEPEGLDAVGADKLLGAQEFALCAVRPFPCEERAA